MIALTTRAESFQYHKDFPGGKSAGTLGDIMEEPVSDEILMGRYQKGDNDAFNQLFGRHRDAVFRYLDRQCPRFAAEEIFQDVWLKLIQARHQFKCDGNNRFAPYLYRIAHNRLMDYFRHHSLKSRVIADSESNHEIMENPNQHSSFSVESRIDAHRKIEKLLLLIEKLPEDQREAFLLKEESGFSVQEIAEVTGVSRETAKSRLRYAFQRIREGMRGML